MARSFVAAVCASLALCSATPAQGTAAPKPDDLTGEWVLYLIRSGEKFDPARIELKESGNKVVGTLNELKLLGTIRGQAMDLTAFRANGDEFGELKIEVVGASLKEH